MKTQLNIPVNQRTSYALESRLLFLVTSVEFYGRRVDQHDRNEVRTLLNTLKARGTASKYAIRIKNVLKIA